MNPKIRTKGDEARNSYERFLDAVAGTIAWRLPRLVVRWALTRAWAHAYTGKHESETCDPAIPFDEVLGRWTGRGSPSQKTIMPINERVKFLLTASDEEIKAALDTDAIPREGETPAHRAIEEISGQKIPTGAELARMLGGGDNLVTVDGQIGDDVKVSGVIGAPDKELDANEAMDVAAFQVAREVMAERLKTDEGLHESYKANIAMHLDDRLNLGHDRRNEVAASLIELIFYS